MGNICLLIFLINVWVPEAGNTADAPNPPESLQRKFDPGVVSTHDLLVRSTDALPT